jgi:hypothetical protein
LQTLVITAFGKLRQENLKFDTSVGCIVKLCFKKKKKIKDTRELLLSLFFSGPCTKKSSCEDMERRHLSTGQEEAPHQEPSQPEP